MRRLVATAAGADRSSRRSLCCGSAGSGAWARASATSIASLLHGQQGAPSRAPGSLPQGGRARALAAAPGSPSWHAGWISTLPPSGVPGRRWSFSSVVLPVPLGPTSPIRSPGRMLKVTLFQDGLGAEVLLDGLDGGANHCCSLLSCLPFLEFLEHGRVGLIKLRFVGTGHPQRPHHAEAANRSVGQPPDACRGFCGGCFFQLGKSRAQPGRAAESVGIKQEEPPRTTRGYSSLGIAQGSRWPYR